MASPCEMPAGVSGFISFHLMHSIKFHNDRRALFPIRHKTNISLPTTRQGGVFVFGMIAGRGSNRARAKREKRSSGSFWCPRACRHAVAWSGVCSRRGSHVPTSLRLGTRAASFFSPRFICHRQRFGEKLVARLRRKPRRKITIAEANAFPFVIRRIFHVLHAPFSAKSPFLFSCFMPSLVV